MWSSKRSLSSLFVGGAAALLLALPASAQDGISGSLSILGFSEGDEIASTRVDRFRERYPDVQLNITEGALDVQQFLTAVATGSPPDLVYLGRDLLSTYAVRGALMPLTDCIASQGIDMSQFREAAVSQVTVDGTVYGIPEFLPITLIIASNQALSEAGLTIDDLNTADWEQLASQAEALTRMENGEVTRIGFDPKMPEFLPLWAAANGVSLISEDGRTAQLDHPAVVEALEYTIRLHDIAGGRQEMMAFRDTWDFFGSNNQIATNQLAAFPMENWYVNVLADVSPDADVAFAAMRDRQGSPITFASGNAWAIPTGAANPTAACAFMQTMTSVDAWVAAAQARADLRAESGTINTGVFTANRVADDIIYNEIVQPSGNATFDNALQLMYDLQDSAFSIPANPAGDEFRQAWIDAVNRALNGEQSAADALAQAQQEAQSALDAAWGQLGT